MNRRNFITLLGAAGLAPALPSMGAASASSGISISVYARAVGHARTRAQVTAKGLAYSLKISAAQADAVMAKLTAKGIIQPVAGAAHAVSKAGDPNMWGLEGAKTPAVNLQRAEMQDVHARQHSEARLEDDSAEPAHAAERTRSGPNTSITSEATQSDAAKPQGILLKTGLLVAAAGGLAALTCLALGTSLTASVTLAFCAAGAVLSLIKARSK